jgi:peptide chain release factor 1
MIDKLEAIKEKYTELSEKLADPEVLSDSQKLQKLMKEQAQLEPVVLKYNEYAEVAGQLEESKEMLKEKLDDEFKELVKEEIKDLSAKKEELENEIKILLLPTDPNDDKDVIVEIRAGVGGDEAGLFAGDLLRMYLRYAERRGWKTEFISVNDQGIGGYKEVIFSIKGKGAYSKLKYESGVHRVQRVPETESSGRIHTSSATVAVLPEADDIDIEINPNDVKVDVFRSSGNGGQSVNTTDSAVRLTHLPYVVILAGIENIFPYLELVDKFFPNLNCFKGVYNFTCVVCKFCIFFKGLN